jgi:hypothetical protein
MLGFQKGSWRVQNLKTTAAALSLHYGGITRSTETLVLNSSIRMPFQAALQMGMRIVQRVGAYAILQASPFLAAPAPIAGDAWRAQVGF